MLLVPFIPLLFYFFCVLGSGACLQILIWCHYSSIFQIQNADDNTYLKDVEPTLAFVLQDDGIAVLNNETGFSADNIRALCDIGNSTKKGSNMGYIGNKGIGFKSVFRVGVNRIIFQLNYIYGYHLKCIYLLFHQSV